MCLRRLSLAPVRFPLRSTGRAAGALLAVPALQASLALLAALPGPARAELPPWVYGEEQRGAPLQAELQVLAVQVSPAGELRAQARLLRIVRQPLPPRLRPGQTIAVAYSLPPARPQGWVGPAPLPRLRAGQRLPAWLAPDPAQAGVYRPAAGGRSFGPSLEAVREPGAAATPQP